MWRHTVLACGLLTGILVAPADAQTPVLFGFVEGDIQFAVRRMLPKNALARRMLTKLKIYRGSEHPHQAQECRPLDLSTI